MFLLKNKWGKLSVIACVLYSLTESTFWRHESTPSPLRRVWPPPSPRVRQCSSTLPVVINLTIQSLVTDIVVLEHLFDLADVDWVAPVFVKFIEHSSGYWWGKFSGVAKGRYVKTTSEHFSRLSFLVRFLIAFRYF